MDIKSWVKHCNNLRNKIVKLDDSELKRKYLLANFTGTKQQKDIETRTPLIEDYFRVKINVKSFNEEEMKKKGEHAINFHDNKQVFDSLSNEFDMPYWAFVSLKNTPLKDFNETFVYQLKACNIHCPWCFVDDYNKDGKIGNGKYFSMDEILDVFQEKNKTQNIMNFRPSGGEPTLAVEQWIEALSQIKKRKLNVFVQGDTNLTTGHFMEKPFDSYAIKPNILERVAEYDNFGLLCSFKGTDTKSFLEATGMPKGYAFLEDERWYSFEKLVKAGIDAYPFVYSPNPKTIESFMEKGANQFGDGFYLKTWIVPLKLYGPEKERLAKKGINSEDYQKKLNSDFLASKEVMQNLISKKYGINYQAIPRKGITLKVKN